MNREDFPGPPFKRGRFDLDDHSTRMTMTPEKVEYELTRVDDSMPANKILCVHILNAVYPITCDIIYRVFSKYGTIARIVIFNKLTVNSMVEFEDVECATEAKDNLHGCSLYTGCCTLKIQFGKKEKLEVYNNTPNTWDYTKSMDVDKIGNFSGVGPIFPQPPFGQENPEHAMSPGKVDMELGLKFKHPPNKILMFSFLNAIYPVNAKLVLSICKKFGDVNKIIVFERLTPQSMVEFNEEDSSSKAELQLHGRNIYPNCNTIKVEFARKDKIDVERNSEMTWCASAVDTGKNEGEAWSPEGREVLIPELPLKPIIKERFMSPQAVEAEFGLWSRQQDSPSKVVLISVMNAIYPITCEVLHRICSPVAKVVRIVIFERLSVQAMIEMESEEDAERLMKKLHGASIYPNCCSLKAELCKKERLKVKRNDDITWDFTVPDLNSFPISSSNSGKRKVLLSNPPVDQVDYDKRVPESKVDFELNRPEKSSEPNKVLLISVLNGIYPMDCDVAYRAFSQFGNLVRVAIFNRVTVQLMIEYSTLDEARAAKKGLNGSDVYPNCCTLKAEYGMKEHVDVKANNRMQGWDFEKEPYVEGGMRVNQQVGGGSYPVSQRLGLLPMNPGGFNPLASRNMIQQNYNMLRDSRLAMMGRSNRQYDRDEFRSSPYDSVGRDDYRGNPYDSWGRDDYRCDRWGFGNDYGGGTPCCMVYKMEPKIFNCDKLFNLLCLYGNIERIMFFKNTENAMVQFDDPRCINTVKENIQNVHLFGKEVHFEQSKKMYVDPVRNPVILEDGSPGYKDFSENKNNRFKRNKGAPRIFPLSSTLHFYNTPKMSNEELFDVFRSRDAPVPRRMKWFESKSDTSGMGILEFRSPEDAAEAIVLVNHTTLEGSKGRDIDMMLTFTKDRKDSEYQE